MTRNEALEVAKTNRAAHVAADIANLFNNGPAFDAIAQFGYRHGWYRVGEFNFREDEVSGEPYDNTQGGWAFL